MIQIILAGITIKADGPKNKVFFMSDWSAEIALRDAGFLRTEHLGPSTFGHVDFFLTRAAIEAGTPKAPASAMLARSQAQPYLYR